MLIVASLFLVLYALGDHQDVVGQRGDLRLRRTASDATGGQR
jgi:hypothetical protein